MNKHIALVKRYLAGDEVSLKELQDNSNAAEAAASAANDVAYAAEAAASAAAELAADAADSQAEGFAKHKGSVDYWVKQYERFNRAGKTRQRSSKFNSNVGRFYADMVDASFVNK